MNDYTASITKDGTNVDYYVDGYGKTPQEFHKEVLFEHIKYPREEILTIVNRKTKKTVFKLKRGFSGS